ncbi:hypothetical protein ACYPKM_05085 [Pseudomonas aeruginosa]
MAKRLFSSNFKRLTVVKKKIYGDFTAYIDGSIPESYGDVPIYFDANSVSTFVVPVPKCYMDVLGSFAGFDTHSTARISLDEKTGTYYLACERGGQKGIIDTLDAVNEHFVEAARKATRKRVIIICSDCYAPSFGDEPEIHHTNRGAIMNHFAKTQTIAHLTFRYKVLWQVGKEYYEDVDPEYPAQWFNAREFGITAQIDWSEEAEQGCAQFESNLRDLSARVARFLKQDSESLKLQFSSKNQPLLGADNG